LDCIEKFQQESDLKKLIGDLLSKIKDYQQTYSKNNENMMKLSNLSEQKG